METIAQILVQGAVTSAVLALVALGFSLVYGVGGTVNLAHGSYFMVGAYGAAVAEARFDAPLALAALIGILSAGVVGLLVDQLVIRPVRSSEVTVLITTLATALLLQSVVTFFFGQPRNRGLSGFVSGGTSVLGVTVQSTRILALVVGVVVVGAALAVLAFTSIGRTVRAVAQDPEAAQLMGVRTTLVSAGVMVAGAMLAGLAGVMVTPYETANPTMWLIPLTQAFAVVILGGLGSIGGTIAAAAVIGFLDRAVAFGLPDGAVLAPLVTAVVILVTLVVRPQGLVPGKAAHA